MLDLGFQRRKSVIDEEDEFDNEAYQREKETRPDQIDNNLFPDYGDDYDDYAKNRRRKLFSLLGEETNNSLNSYDTRLNVDKLHRRQEKDNASQPLQLKPMQISNHHLRQNQTELKLESPVKKVEQIKPKGKRPAKRQKVRSAKANVRPRDREELKVKERPAVPSEQLKVKQHQIQRSRKMNQTQIQRLKDSKIQFLERNAPLALNPTVAKQQRTVTRAVELQQAANKRFTTPRRDINRPLVRLNQRDTDTRERLRDKEIEMNMPLRQDLENSIHRGKMITRDKMDKKWLDPVREEDQVGNRDEVRNKAKNTRDTREGERDSLWGPPEDFTTDDEDLTPAPVFDTEVNWSQTFHVNHLDLQARRSDWIDLRCNVSGNLLLHSSDALPIVEAFMDQFKEKHQG